MAFLILLAHLPVLILIAYCWREDSRYRIGFTPLIVYLLVDVTFSWNIWLLLVDHDVNVTAYALFIPLVATSCFCMGFLFCSKYIMDYCRHPHASCQFDHYLLKPVERPGDIIVYKAAMILLAFIGITAGSYYYQGLPPTIKGIARLYAEEEINKEVQQIVTHGRLEITKSHFFGGGYRGQGITRSIMVGAWSYGLALSVVMAAVYRKTRWKMGVLLFFIGAFYYVAGAGERSRFVWTVAAGLIALTYVSRIRTRHILSIFVILLCFLVAMTILLNRYEPLQSNDQLMRNVMASIGRRILTGNKINNVRMMNLLAEGALHPTYGRTHLTDILNVLPGIQVLPLAYKIGELVDPGKTTYYSGTYLGTVYIDFGLIGVITIYLMLGVLIKLSFYFFLKVPKTIENITFLSLMVMQLGKVSIMSGIISFTAGMVPLFVIHCIVKIVFHTLPCKKPFQRYIAVNNTD